MTKSYNINDSESVITVKYTCVPGAVWDIVISACNIIMTNS